MFIALALYTAARAGARRHAPHAAPRQVQGGVPLEKVTAFLGNRKEMVVQVYGHHSPEWLLEATRALDETGVTGPLAPETKMAVRRKS